MQIDSCFFFFFFLMGLHRHGPHRLPIAYKFRLPNAPLLNKLSSLLRRSYSKNWTVDGQQTGGSNAMIWAYNCQKTLCSLTHEKSTFFADHQLQYLWRSDIFAAVTGKSVNILARNICERKLFEGISTIKKSFRPGKYSGVNQVM